MFPAHWWWLVCASLQQEVTVQLLFERVGLQGSTTHCSHLGSSNPLRPQHLLSLLVAQILRSSSFAVRYTSCRSDLSAAGWIPRQAGTSVLQELQKMVDVEK